MSIVAKSTKAYSGFAPTQIPGCDVWYDAADSSAVVLSGASVTQWSDKSGNAKHLTAYNAPTYTGLLNGSKIITTNGSTSYLENSSYSLAQPFTVFVVCTLRGSTSGAYYVFEGTTGTGTAVILYSGAASGNLLMWAGTANVQPNPVVPFSSNVPLLYSAIFNGSTSSLGVNGLVTSGLNPGTNPKVNLRFGRAWTGDYQNGDWAEVIVYNRNLATSERQQVEGYLAQKWGLSSVMPASHPFGLSIAPSPQTFSPTDLAGCYFWVDAADSSTLTLSGTNVSAWRDKSSNAFPLTLTGTPTWTSNSVNFTGSQSFTNSAISLNLSSMSVFLVGYNVTGITNGGGLLSLVPLSTGTDYNQTNAITYNFSSTLAQLYTTFNYTASAINANYISPTNPILFTHVQNGTAMTLYSLGTSFYSTTTNFTPGTTTGLAIGARYQHGNGTASAYLYGTVKEIIVYNTALTTTQRQMVENYLAWKWGLNQSLVARPSVRPLPLYTRPINPLDIPVCTLWLDAADRSTLTLSGSNVTAWADKSGNGNTMSNTTGSNLPSFSNTGFNGNYPSVFFNSAVGTNLTNTSSSLFQSTAFDVYAVWKVSGEETSLLWYDLPDRIFILNGQGNNSLFGNPPFLVHWGSGGSGTWRFNGTNYIGTNPVLYNVSSTGSQMGAFLNGSANGSATVSYPGTTAPKQIYLYNPGFKWAQTNANMAEILVFSSVLSTSQRQQVEGYLAQKWGLSANIPTTHPFKRFPSLTTTFAPTQLSGLSLWLDAADPSTVTTTGTTVTAWTDKSGNRRNAVFGTNKPSYVPSNRYLETFNNNTDIRLPAAAFTNTTNQTCTLFIIYSDKQEGSNEQALFSTLDVGLYQFLRRPSFEYVIRGNMTFTDTNYVAFRNRLATTSQIIYSMQYTAGVTGSSNYIVAPNGFSWNPIANNTQFVSDDVYLGGVSSFGGGGDVHANLKIYEVVVYNNVVLSTVQRQQVEGYLAWKWGLVGSLPSTHPYKKFTP